MATPAPDAVKRLVDHFDQNRKVFLSDDYKEEQLSRAKTLREQLHVLGRQRLGRRDSCRKTQAGA